MNAERSRRSEPRLDGLRILVVEDHVDSRDALRQMLAAQGAEVLVASDGQEALAGLEATIPDLILSDLRMPRIDGLELATRVRHDVRWARIPLIAVTAYNSPADLRATLEAGFDAHVEKPVDFDLLTATVQRVLRGGRRRGRRSRPDTGHPSGEGT
ncbi:MAG TPA: response regulator [Methylomirabilota bacterium]|nr:response regulator [Methylomirabilota bacterium]